MMNAPPIARAAMLALALLSALYRGALAAQSAQLGAPAPSFALESASGVPLTLRTFAGRPLVINVFASWCPPCRQELPAIVAAAQRSGGDIAFLGVDEQEPAEMGRRFTRAMRIPYPVARDAGQFAALYGSRSLPETIFIRADGRVSAIHHGPISAAELQTRLAAIGLPR